MKTTASGLAIFLAGASMAQTRVRGGVSDSPTDLPDEQLFRATEQFWLAIGRGRIERSAIKWHKQLRVRQNAFVVYAGGAQLWLVASTGNLAFFVDYKREREQRARHDRDMISCFPNEEAERQAGMNIIHALGFTDALTTKFRHMEEGTTTAENVAKRFVISFSSELGGIHQISVVVDRKDAHVTEVWCPPLRNGFHMFNLN